MDRVNQANWTIKPYHQVVASLGHSRIDILKVCVLVACAVALNAVQ
jgi:hypothetical protein